MQRSDVVIIGGGASGLSAAIAAARLGARVALLEAGPRVGKKILVSGNGRCNLTNLAASSEAYNHPDLVGPILGRYTCGTIRSFFGDMGLLTQSDDEGRVYPATNAASSVLDVLRLECEYLGIDVRCEFEVAHVFKAPDSDGFEVSSTAGERLRADTVVVAAGGGDTLLEGLGHTLVDGGPVLGPVKTDAAPIRGLSGVRVRCTATLLVDTDADGLGGRVITSERGELLFRDYGVSGIMVFDLSRYLRDGCVISIDFFPDVSQPDLKTMIEGRCETLSWRTAETIFAGMLHDRVARAILREAGVSANSSAASLPHERVASLLKDFRLKVLGMADVRQAQVTRGGASVVEFDPRTMASRRMNGLFAAGEVLDIDGRSGGFNLHWAWASGIVAGEGAARAAIDRGSDGTTPDRAPV
ncbi:MAG: BaiN/RdsA family NAD(P)/FAD-dependent oxidoreductase [Coriobacteriia bacterium]